MDKVEQVLDRSVVTIIVLILVVVGAVDLLLDDTLSKDYEKFVETVAWIIGPVAVARGLKARR